MRKETGFLRLLLLLVILLMTPGMASALLITNPDEIQVEGLVSFGEDGSAWIRWNGHEILVSAGYMIGKDLRVVAVRHDSVVLYRPETKQYHVLTPGIELAHKDRSAVIWTSPLPIWKISRMVALAYRKDFICHYSTQAQNQVRRHVVNMEDMMDLVVSPHHRFYPRHGMLYIAPVHIEGSGWKYLLERIQKYRSKGLAEWFPALNEAGTIISNGKPLDQTLQRIAYATNVRIIWQKPVIMPLYCSLRDRPWHEILEAVVIFNGLEIHPSRDGLEIK